MITVCISPNSSLKLISEFIVVALLETKLLSLFMMVSFLKPFISDGNKLVIDIEEFFFIFY